MKSLKIFCLFLVLMVFASQAVQAQIEEHELNLLEETATVTFECNNCNEENRFLLTGTEPFKFKNVSFPFNQEMKLGDYKMIYLQNGVQLIDLPFQINRDSENVIKVNAGISGQ